MKNNTIFCLSGFDGTYLKDFVYMLLIEVPTVEKRPLPESF